MPSLHFFRWTEQLENSGHEVYWFDIVDGSPTQRLPWVKKINGWKQKYPNFRGRYFIKNKLPLIYRYLRFLIERNTAKEFEKVLERIKPDAVHSFAIQISCLPIINIMEKHSHIKWIYSSWGSDLFKPMSVGISEVQMRRITKRVDYYISDCNRDYNIIKEYGFKGNYLGTIPGGGGYDLKFINNFIVKPTNERHTILVKGYQGKYGRSIEVLKAIKKISKELKNFKIIVFSADNEVIRFSKKNKLSEILNISILRKEKFIPHLEIMKLMGEALIYIGNSTSDGIPNTLIEAIVMGAFPIQSNPGGATSEIITHNENGLLIEDCNDVESIEELINKSLKSSKLIERAFIINQMELKHNFDIELIKKKALDKYAIVEKKKKV